MAALPVAVRIDCRRKASAAPSMGEAAKADPAKIGAAETAAAASAVVASFIVASFIVANRRNRVIVNSPIVCDETIGLTSRPPAQPRLLT